MASWSKTLIRLGTALIPLRRVRKRLRRRLLDQDRDARIRALLPVLRDRYAAHARRCREKLGRGERIRVCFLVCDAAMFSAEPVYRQMLSDSRFEPFIAVAPRVSRGEDFLRTTLAKTLETLTARYGRVDSLYDPETRARAPLEGRADVVFSSVVYDDQTFADYTAEPLSRFALTLCISYGYSGLLLSDVRRVCFLPQYAQFWRVFLPTSAVVEQWRTANPLLAGVLREGGYSKMDRLAETPVRPGRPRTVLVCPHHTLARDGEGLALSNFLRYADFFLKLPGRFPDIRFVFRPHPLLFPRLETSEWWGKARTDAYRAALEACPNVEFQQGGDYFDAFANSDAMIHDCGSFFAEYFYTGKPQCYLLESREAVDREFTDFGKRLHAHAYHAFTEDEIVSFVENVVLRGDDPHRSERAAFAAAEVCLHHPHAAARVISELEESLR